MGVVSTVFPFRLTPSSDWSEFMRPPPSPTPPSRYHPNAKSPEPLSELPLLPHPPSAKLSNTNRVRNQRKEHHLPVKPEVCQPEALDGLYTRPERASTAPSRYPVTARAASVGPPSS